MLPYRGGFLGRTLVYDSSLLLTLMCLQEILVYRLNKPGKFLSTSGSRVVFDQGILSFYFSFHEHR